MKFEDLEKKLNDTKEILKHIGKSLITVEKNSFAIAKDIDNLKIMGEKNERNYWNSYKYTRGSFYT